jgi:ABC-2 type transport system ATP-binding protein
MTTHYMDEAEHCDRIAIIDQGRLVALDTPDALKRRVRADIVVLKTDDDERAVEEIRERFDLQPKREDGRIRLEVQDGAEFIPRLVCDLPVAIRSVDLHRPTLDDVFINLTGHAIRDEEGSPLDTMRLAVSCGEEGAGDERRGSEGRLPPARRCARPSAPTCAAFT